MDSDVKQQYRTPRELPNGDGEAELAVSRETYVDLLVLANVTDPRAWPEGMQECAALLKRIRAIEEVCRVAHGEWDWELLEEDTQDEYDDLCSSLNKLRYAGEKVEWLDLQDYMQPYCQ
jgi:hypothetical protein